MLKVVAEEVREGEEGQSEYKKRIDRERKERLGEKVIHGKFFSGTWRRWQIRGHGSG